MARPKTDDSTHQWPFRVEDNPLVQDAVGEYYYESDKLSAIWKNRYDEQRTDVDHNQFVKQIITDVYGGALTEPKISAKIRSYIESNLTFGIYKYLNQDSSIRKYLGSGFAGGIEVEVAAAEKLVITIKGPSWLKFYFTGWKTYRITAKDNIPSRGHLVFYNSGGFKIVTKSVVIPGHPPGLYIENAIKDLERTIPDVVRYTVEQEFDPDEDEEMAYNDYEQMQLEDEKRELEYQREQTRELIRKSQQYANEVAIEELRDAVRSNSLDAEDYYREEIIQRERLIQRAKLNRDQVSKNLKSRAGLALNNSIEAYLESYAVGMQSDFTESKNEMEAKMKNLEQRFPQKSARARVRKVREKYGL